VRVESYSMAIIVSYSDIEATDLVKGILQKDKLAESLPVYRDSVKTFLWRVDTKYYTADVHLCIVEKEQFGNGEVLENLQALVVHFDNMKESSFNRVKRLVSLVDGFEPDVKLLVCDNYSQGNVAIPKLTAQQWCLQHEFELVELYPDELSDTEDDFAETTGFERIIQALHAHTWSNLVMKEKSSLFSPHHKIGEKTDSNKCSSLDETKDLEASIASVNIQDNSEDTFKDGLPDADLLDVLGSEKSEQSFEALFDAFQQMKDKAKDLEFSERKAYAEKVAIAFWKAMSEDEEEIAGLDNDSE